MENNNFFEVKTAVRSKTQPHGPSATSWQEPKVKNQFGQKSYGDIRSPEVRDLEDVSMTRDVNGFSV